MSNNRRRGKSFKEKIEENPIILYCVTVVAIGGVIFGISNYYFEKEKALFVAAQEVEYKQKMDLLDKERSRIAFHMENESGVLDFEAMKINPRNLENNYIQVQDLPIGIPKVSGLDSWKWRYTTAYDLCLEIDSSIVYDTVICELLKLEKYMCLEKEDAYSMSRIEKDGVKKYRIKPRILFQYVKYDLIFDKSIIKLASKIIYDDFKGLIDPKSFEDSTGKFVPDSIFKTDTPLDSYKRKLLLDQFKIEADSRLEDEYGYFNNESYFFDRDHFMINGYFNIDEKHSVEVKKIYKTRIAVMGKNGFYCLISQLPVTSNYSDVKFVYSLITGLKLLDN